MYSLGRRRVYSSWNEGVQEQLQTHEDQGILNAKSKAAFLADPSNLEALRQLTLAYLDLPILEKMLCRAAFQRNSVLDAAFNLDTPLERNPDLPEHVINIILDFIVKTKEQTYSAKNTRPDVKFDTVRSILSVCKLWRKLWLADDFKWIKGKVHLTTTFLTQALAVDCIRLGFKHLRYFKLTNSSYDNKTWAPPEIARFLTVLQAALPSLTALTVPALFTSQNSAHLIPVLEGLPNLKKLSFISSVYGVQPSFDILLKQGHPDLLSKLTHFKSYVSTYTSQRFNPSPALEVLHCGSTPFVNSQLALGGPVWTNLREMFLNIRMDTNTWAAFGKTTSSETLRTLGLGTECIRRLTKYDLDTFVNLEHLLLGYSSEMQFAVPSFSVESCRVSWLHLYHWSKYLKKLKSIRFGGIDVTPQGTEEPSLELLLSLLRLNQVDIVAMVDLVVKNAPAFPALETLPTDLLWKHALPLAGKLPLPFPKLKRLSVTSESLDLPQLCNIYVAQGLENFPADFGWYTNATLKYPFYKARMQPFLSKAKLLRAQTIDNPQK